MSGSNQDKNAEYKLADDLWDIYWEFRRLKNYPMPSTAPINKLIDAETGLEQHIMEEFAHWLVHDIFPRMPKVEGYQNEPV